MPKNNIRKTLRAWLAGAFLAVAVPHAHAAAFLQPLSGVDSMLTTIVSKSRISGGLAKDASGNLAMDANMNFMFNFSGNVFFPVANPLNGQLEATSGPIGTVSGQAAFPPEFASLAIQTYAWLKNGANPAEMPAMPSKINWTMNDLTVVMGGTTYRPLPNADMSLEGRAFTGLGPVEIGRLLNGSKGLSMSVRMGGCLAMQGVSGPQAGKIGTQCMNGTFTFDLSGINLNNPMASTLNGTGTSNCWLVLQKPMQ